MHFDNAFYGTDNQCAAKMSEKLIAKNYYAAVGHLVKGKLFYHRMNVRCMLEFKLAMLIKPDRDEYSLDCMSDFVLRTGDEDLIGQFREESAALAQQAKDILKATNWRAKKMPPDESALLQELIQGLCRRVEVHGGAVRSMYVADFGKEIPVIAAVIDSRMQSELRNAIFDDIMDYLNAFPVLAAHMSISGVKALPGH